MRYTTLKKILRPIFRNSYKEINGLEFIPAQGPYLIATNHVDFLDAFFISLALDIHKNQDIFFLSKTNNYWWSAAALPIDPKDKQKSIEQAIAYLKQGKIIGNFIEGQRNPEKYLLEGKTGTVRMALMAQIPVIPLGIISKIHKNYISAVFNLLSKKHKVIINIGQPLTFEKYYSQEITKPLLIDLTREVAKKLAPLCGKAYLF